MNSLSKKILKEIETRRISPRSQWYFLTKEWFLWLMWGVVTLFGSVAFSVVLFFFFNIDWGEQRVLEFSKWEGLLRMIPVVWLVVFVSFFGLSFFNACQTRRGYRYHGTILLSTLVVSLVLGFVGYRLGVAHIVEDNFGSYLPHYQTLVERKFRMWHHPEEGRLGGRIVSIEGQYAFMLEDRHFSVWDVKHQQDNASWIRVGEVVRMRGKVVDNGRFEAHTLVPVQIYGGKRRFLEKHFHNVPCVKERRDTMRMKECGFGQSVE